MITGALIKTALRTMREEWECISLPSSTSPKSSLNNMDDEPDHFIKNENIVDSNLDEDDWSNASSLSLYSDSDSLSNALTILLDDENDDSDDGSDSGYETVQPFHSTP
jgi:hypothetical protein